MKNYRIRVPVTGATGEQIYEVAAESVEAAMAAYESGDLECVWEEIEVQSTGEPEIEEVDQ